MKYSSKKSLFMILLIAVIFWTADASSRSWGLSFGMSYLVPEEWGHGYCLDGRFLGQKGEHLQYGLSVSSSLWLPVSEAPSGREGADWESSGSAWLFELGPIVRVFSTSPKPDNLCIFMHGGAGVTFVSSDAEIIIYPVVPDPTGTSREIMGSQTAPYVEIGAGIQQTIEFIIASQAIFANPDTAFEISFKIGVNF